ncbi:hypothetical protein [Streptodolium elevatio]
MNRPTHHGPERPEHQYADAELRPVLARAMADIRFSEPGMPDLLGPAMAEGTRLRRKRRTNLLVALSASAALVLGGVVGGVAYLGGDTAAGPAGVPSGPEESASGRQLTPVEALATALEPYLRPRGVVIDAKPWNVRRDPPSGATFLVSITLRDRAGRAGAIVLSGGPMSGVMPTKGNDATCSSVLRGDTEAGFEIEDNPTCTKWAARADGSQTWSVYVQRDEAAGKSGRSGAVRLGPGDEVFRAWMWEPPSGAAESGTLVLKDTVLAEIVADPAVAQALEQVPLPTPGSAVTPPSPWSVDDVATSAPPRGATSDSSPGPTSGSTTGSASRSTSGATSGSTSGSTPDLTD